MTLHKIQLNEDNIKPKMFLDWLVELSLKEASVVVIVQQYSLVADIPRRPYLQTLDQYWTRCTWFGNIPLCYNCQHSLRQTSVGNTLCEPVKINAILFGYVLLVEWYIQARLNKLSSCNEAVYFNEGLRDFEEPSQSRLGFRQYDVV